MKIMSINAGSSSLKFSLFDMSNEEVLISGVFERIGIEGGTYTLKYNGEKIKVQKELKDHSVAVQTLIDELLNKTNKSSLIRNVDNNFEIIFFIRIFTVISYLAIDTIYIIT